MLLGVLPAAGQKSIPQATEAINSMTNFCLKLGGKVNKLLNEFPSLLAERTPEEIEAALVEEQKASTEKLALIAKGKDWHEYQHD